jgi:hypothetical protein
MPLHTERGIDTHISSQHHVQRVGGACAKTTADVRVVCLRPSRRFPRLIRVLYSPREFAYSRLTPLAAHDQLTVHTVHTGLAGHKVGAHRHAIDAVGMPFERRDAFGRRLARQCPHLDHLVVASARHHGPRERDRAHNVRVATQLARQHAGRHGEGADHVVATAHSPSRVRRPPWPLRTPRPVVLGCGRVCRLAPPPAAHPPTSQRRAESSMLPVAIASSVTATHNNARVCSEVGHGSGWRAHDILDGLQRTRVDCIKGPREHFKAHTVSALIQVVHTEFTWCRSPVL